MVSSVSAPITSGIPSSVVPYIPAHVGTHSAPSSASEYVPAPALSSTPLDVASTSWSALMEAESPKEPQPRDKFRTERVSVAEIPVPSHR